MCESVSASTNIQVCHVNLRGKVWKVGENFCLQYCLQLCHSRMQPCCVSVQANCAILIIGFHFWHKWWGFVDQLRTSPGHLYLTLRIFSSCFLPLQSFHVQVASLLHVQSILSKVKEEIYLEYFSLVFYLLHQHLEKFLPSSPLGSILREKKFRLLLLDRHLENFLSWI